MSDYLCPNCRGGFPAERLNAKEKRCCPWCRQPMGDYDQSEPGVISKTVQKTDAEPPHGVLGNLFGLGPDDD